MITDVKYYIGARADVKALLQEKVKIHWSKITRALIKNLKYLGYTNVDKHPDFMEEDGTYVRSIFIFPQDSEISTLSKESQDRFDKYTQFKEITNADLISWINTINPKRTLSLDTKDTEWLKI